jgi:hypothetical protein
MEEKNNCYCSFLFLTFDKNNIDIYYYFCLFEANFNVRVFPALRANRASTDPTVIQPKASTSARTAALAGMS